MHIKIDFETRTLLENLAKEMDLSIAKCVRHILKETGDYIEHHLFNGKRKGSAVDFCDARYDLYVRITEEDYRKLKTLHSTLNTFSIAQIMRTAITRYLEFRQRSGTEKLKAFLHWFNERWKNKLLRKAGEIKREKQVALCRGYILTLSTSFIMMKIKKCE